MFNLKHKKKMICTCPRGATLPGIPNVVCPETFGQIQKIAFQRIQKSSGQKNSFTSSDDIKLKASWTPLLSAADDTKIVVSPVIQAPETEAGAPITFGGGNDTPNGVEEIVGREATSFTGVLRKMPQNVVKAMKEMMCESIGIYLFDNNGAIGCLKQGESTSATYFPIPISAFFVGDKSLGGLEEPDSNAIQWSFLPNWSDNLVMVAPTDFNPLTDLIVASE